MKLFRLLVEKYLKKDGGDDWRFCSLASSILSDITMNNVTKGGPKNLPKLIQSKSSKLNQRQRLQVKL